MKYKMSRFMALHIDNGEDAVKFYSEILGFTVKVREGDSVELESEERTIYFDNTKYCKGLVLEFNVEDLDAAKKELLDNGCEIIKWEGKGGCCYIRDPFGLTFNVWQD